MFVVGIKSLQIKIFKFKTKDYNKSNNNVFNLLKVSGDKFFYTNIYNGISYEWTCAIL